MPFLKAVVFEDMKSFVRVVMDVPEQLVTAVFNAVHEKWTWPLDHLSPCEDRSSSSFEPSNQSTRRLVFLISNAVIKLWILLFCSTGLITTYSRQKSNGKIKCKHQVAGHITDTFCALLLSGLCSAGCSSLESIVALWCHRNLTLRGPNTDTSVLQPARQQK